jgi:hypothetical protein
MKKINGQSHKSYLRVGSVYVSIYDQWDSAFALSNLPAGKIGVGNGKDLCDVVVEDLAELEHRLPGHFLLPLRVKGLRVLQKFKIDQKFRRRIY